MIAPVVTFGVFVAIQRETTGLNVTQAFTSLSLIYLLCNSVATFVGSLPTLGGSLGCFERIEKFLATEESPAVRSSYGLTSDAENVGVKIVNGSFGFEKSKPVLKDINLALHDQSFTIISGPTGSGKSILMQALLGELACLNPEGSVTSSFHRAAVCEQTPWLCNTTIRSSIVGSADFDPAWYETVLEACALKPDLERIEDGDMSEIGSGGITLSGGQKSRIVSLVPSFINVVLHSSVLAELIPSSYHGSG